MKVLKSSQWRQGASSYLQGEWNCPMKAGFRRPGFLSQANTGPAPAQPCPGRTRSLKGSSSPPGTTPREADFTREPVGLAVSQTAAGPVCSVAPVPQGPTQPPERGWEPMGKRLAPLPLRPARPGCRRARPSRGGSKAAASCFAFFFHFGF